jgi:alpha/beta superfamily hydrolase
MQATEAQNADSLAMAYESGFFGNRRGKQLFYVFEGPPDAPTAVVCCNPFLEEKVFSHRVYFNLTRAVASAGILGCRMDYEGDGDSEGDLAEITIDDWVDDVVDFTAFMTARLGKKRLVLHGLRMGAAVAARAAHHVEASGVLMWEPMVRGEACYKHWLRTNVTTQLATLNKVVTPRSRLEALLAAGETINVGGYDVGSRLTSSIRGIDLERELANAPFPVDVILSARGEDRNPDPLLGDFAERVGARTTVVRSSPFIQKTKIYDVEQAELIEASVRLLVPVMAGGSTQP